MGELDERIAAAAARLREAEASGVPIEPIRDEFPDGDIALAYSIQSINTEFRQKAGGVVIGRKIGLTNPAVQAQFGVGQPDFGVLWADRSYADREPIPPNHVLQPRVEAEVALVLDRDVDAERPGPADLMRAIGYATPAIEVIGSRIVDWRIGIVDTIADNASGGGIVLGGRARRLSDVDLASVTMQMTDQGGAVVSHGSGRDCLGNPLTAAVWLARTVAALGVPLRAGEVLMTGSLGPIAPTTPGQNYTAHIEGLGDVTASLAGA